MKKEINIIKVLLITVAITIAVIVVAVGLAKEMVNYDEVTEMQIRITYSMTARSDTYALMRENGNWYITHSESLFAGDFEHKFVVDEAVAIRIISTLEKYKVHKWDDYDLIFELKKKIGSIATDGNSYGFYMQFSDGSTVQTSAYNVSPDDFMAVLNVIKKEYESLFGEGE